MASSVNVGKVLQGLSVLAPGALKESAAAAFQELEIDMAEMKTRTPVETGNLRNSGFVNLPKMSKHEAEISLGFGGPSIGYAVPVHEITTSHHPVGQAKFMESVMIESAPTLVKRIAARVDLSRIV